MSDYVKSTDFAVKDGLVTGNPLKIISGTEINTEFNNIQTAVATKADLASPALTGTPTAPTQAAGNNTPRIATTAFVQSAVNAGIPVGGIIMWGGLLANIPTNYQICDGTNGTPDLRSKFILGANTETGGVLTSNLTGAATSTGGSKDAVVVSHTHTAAVTDPGHTHTASGTVHLIGAGGGFDWAGASGSATTRTTNSGTTGISVSNTTTGVSGTNQNLPPYYVLAYIQRMS